MLALSHQHMRQNAIAGRVGLTRATVNRILQRHAVTLTLVPGKSTGAPRRPPPRQDRALLRKIRQDRFIRARASMVRMRNLYGMRAGRKTINNQLLFRGYRAYKPTGTHLFTADHRRFCMEMAQRWQILTMAHWQHVIFGDESNLTR